MLVVIPVFLLLLMDLLLDWLRFGFIRLVQGALLCLFLLLPLFFLALLLRLRFLED